MLYFELMTRPVVDIELDLTDLKTWRKNDHSVWVRMLKIDSELSSQTWPSRVCVEANGNTLLQVDEPEEGHVRRDVPKNITTGLKAGKNSIKITATDGYVAGFAVALVRGVARTVQQMASEIDICTDEVALARVSQLVQEASTVADEDNDEVSVLISNKLKLRCPLSFERVVIPVRGETCQHLQCFGLGAYLEANMKMRALNNRWTCPVCGNVLKPRELRIDTYVEKVLAETPIHIDEVLVDQSGSYKCLEDGVVKMTPSSAPAAGSSDLATTAVAEGGSREPQQKRQKKGRAEAGDAADEAQPAPTGSTEVN